MISRNIWIQVSHCGRRCAFENEHSGVYAQVRCELGFTKRTKWLSCRCSSWIGKDWIPPSSVVSLYEREHTISLNFAFLQIVLDTEMLLWFQMELGSHFIIIIYTIQVMNESNRTCDVWSGWECKRESFRIEREWREQKEAWPMRSGESERGIILLLTRTTWRQRITSKNACRRGIKNRNIMTTHQTNKSSKQKKCVALSSDNITQLC